MTDHLHKTRAQASAGSYQMPAKPVEPPAPSRDDQPAQSEPAPKSRKAKPQ